MSCARQIILPREENLTRPTQVILPKRAIYRPSLLLEVKEPLRGSGSPTRSGLARHEEASLLERVCRRLGIHCSATSEYGRRALRIMRKRLAEGHTQEELLRVTEYGRAQWDQGQRFSGLKDLLWLWGVRLPALLAGAAAAGDTPGHLVHRTGDALTEWQAGVETMLARQRGERKS